MNNQKNSPNITLISIVVLVIAVLVVGGVWWLIRSSTTETPTPVLNDNTSQLANTNTFEHDCRTDTGHVWCEAEQKCLWEYLVGVDCTNSLTIKQVKSQQYQLTLDLHNYAPGKETEKDLTHTPIWNVSPGNAIQLITDDQTYQLDFDESGTNQFELDDFTVGILNTAEECQPRIPYLTINFNQEIDENTTLDIIAKEYGQERVEKNVTAYANTTKTCPEQSCCPDYNQSTTYPDEKIMARCYKAGNALGAEIYKCTVWLYPFQYNPSTQELTVTTDFSLLLTLKNPANSNLNTNTTNTNINTVTSNTNSQTNQNTNLNISSNLNTNSASTNQTNNAPIINTSVNSNTNSNTNTNQIVDCATLGQTGPNYSLGPSDPKKEIQCCEGLVLKDPLSAYRDDCEAGEGFGTMCIVCGDGICDSTYESICNCPEDCD